MEAAAGLASMGRVHRAQRMTFVCPEHKCCCHGVSDISALLSAVLGPSTNPSAFDLSPTSRINGHLLGY
jgi:hypothetical protein